jgi:hypothetical protein
MTFLTSNLRALCESKAFIAASSRRVSPVTLAAVIVTFEKSVYLNFYLVHLLFHYTHDVLDQSGHLCVKKAQT